MMKKLRRWMSLALVAVMALAMGMTAAAASSITITGSDEGHTYEAYRIFTGTLHTDGTLSDVEWDSTSVDGNGLLTELQEITDGAIGTAFAACGDAADVANVLSDNNTNTAFAEEFADVVAQHLLNATATADMSMSGDDYVFSDLEAGYYLIKDQDGSLSGTKAYTDFILRVSNGNLTIPVKASVPTLEKKVQENSTGEWGDVADGSIYRAVGDEVNFRLKGTMPSTLSSYSSYSYTFHDTLSAGLTLDSDTIVVTYYPSQDDMDNSQNGTPVDVKDATEVINPSDADGCFVFTAAANSGEAFTLSCTNVKVISGITLTANGIFVVTYSAQLNENAVIAGDGNPNSAYLEFSNNPNGSGTGTTPVSVVTVFTFDLVVNKVDDQPTPQPLSGAEFTLYDSNENRIAVLDGVTSSSPTSFTISGLDAGTYILKETQTPSGYNTIDPITFRVVPVYSGTPLALTDLTVDDGQGNSITGFTAQATPTGGSASITATVQNQSGATFPSTGGMGTRLFYAVGAVLLLGSGILLVARRRMRREG